jgi:transcriptional regulator with XRE-family HTH domain
MIPAASTRSRPTETTREASRLTAAMTVVLGQAVRRGRKRLRLTQARLGVRIGVQQPWISKIESGQGRAVPLKTWIRIGVALGQPLTVSFTRPLGESRQPTDAGHLEMQEALLRLARSTGRTATFELPTRPADPSRSIDVCVRDPRQRLLIIEEAWNTFGDIGAAIRATHHKEAEAAELAATVDDGPAFRVAVVWVVRASAANRALFARYPEIIRSAFPGSSRAWVRALTAGGPAPQASGFVWYDSAISRIHEWRTAGTGAARY